MSKSSGTGYGRNGIKRKPLSALITIVDDRRVQTARKISCPRALIGGRLVPASSSRQYRAELPTPAKRTGGLMRTKALLDAAIRVWELKQRGRG